MTIFQMRAGKKVILVIDGSERTRALIKRGFPTLPWRVILGNKKGNILFKPLFCWGLGLLGITRTEGNFLTSYLPFYYLLMDSPND